MRLRRSFAALALAGCGLVLGAAASCSSSEPEACPSACPHDYAKFDPTPPVSFRSDVYPLMRERCATPSCHGPTDCSQGTCVDKADAKLYLGPDPGDNATIIDLGLRQFVAAQLVDVGSKTAPSMKIVAPNDPEHSFLLLKLDGCQGKSGLSCTPQDPKATGCGERMPNGKAALCDADRDAFRRWVAQGAVVD